MIKYIFFLFCLTCMVTCQYNETNHTNTTYYEYGRYNKSQFIQSNECLIFSSLSLINYVNFFISGQNSPNYNSTFKVSLIRQDTNTNILIQCNEREDFCSIDSYDSGYHVLDPNIYDLVVCNTNTLTWEYYYIINFTFEYTNGTSSYKEDDDEYSTSSSKNEFFSLTLLIILVVLILCFCIIFMLYLSFVNYKKEKTKEYSSLVNSHE